MRKQLSLESVCQPGEEWDGALAKAGCEESIQEQLPSAPEMGLGLQKACDTTENKMMPWRLPYPNQSQRHQGPCYTSSDLSQECQWTMQQVGKQVAINWSCGLLPPTKTASAPHLPNKLASHLTEEARRAWHRESWKSEHFSQTQSFI